MFLHPETVYKEIDMIGKKDIFKIWDLVEVNISKTIIYKLLNMARLHLIFNNSKFHSCSWVIALLLLCLLKIHKALSSWMSN